MFVRNKVKNLHLTIHTFKTNVGAGAPVFDTNLFGWFGDLLRLK